MNIKEKCGHLYYINDQNPIKTLTLVLILIEYTNSEVPLYLHSHIL